MTDKSLAILLTEEESRLVSAIEFDPLAVRGPEAVRRNGDLVGQLLALLKARDGIPKHRIRWYTDPDYYVGGRGRSRYEKFVGNHADNVPYHPHFLDVLKYFLYGPDLPESVIEAFRNEVLGCGQVTSGDITPLAKFARTQARANGLLGPENAEEFYKLALECGMSATYGQAIRKSVLPVR